MIKQIIILFFVINISSIATAQYHELEFDTNTRHIFMVNANMDINSSDVSNNYISTLNRGGFINEDTKADGLTPCSERSLAGKTADYHLLAAWRASRFFKDDSTWFIAGFSYKTLNELEYTPNAYKLAFYGNAQWEGETIEIGPLEYQSINWHQWKFGLVHQYRGKHGYLTGGAIFNFNVGMDYSRFNIEKASLYTAPYGEEITLNTKHQLMLSDTLPLTPLSFGGIGLAFDIFYSWKSLDDRMSITTQFLNLGIINWNKESFYKIADTIYHYDGFEVENIFDWKDDPFSGFSTDTLREQFISSENQRKQSSNLPTILRIDGRYNLTEKVSLKASISQTFFSRQKPLVNLAVGVRVCDNFTVIPSIIYGGYGKLNGGLHLRYDYNHKWFFHVGSNYLNSIIFPDEMSGMGGYLLFIRKM